MLTANEIEVLQLLEQLRSRSLSLADQSKPVEEIDELLQQLADEVDEKIILKQPATSSFIKLCRKRLVDAQRECLNNYELLRAQNVQQLLPQEPTSEPTVSRVYDTIDESDDKGLQQSLYESRAESMTQVLRRMHAMAQAEVARGEMNIDELDMSSRTLRELQEQYSGIDILLNGSRILVKVLNEADKWDRRGVYASLAFLAFALSYVIFRRILHAPIKLVLWILVKLFGLGRIVGSLVPDKETSSIQVSASVTSAPSETSTPSIDSTDLETTTTGIIETGECVIDEFVTEEPVQEPVTDIGSYHTDELHTDAYTYIHDEL